MAREYRLLAWANFALLVAAVLKFIPIFISLAHGLTLTAEQIDAGLAADRAWALDLISDTPYLLMVWVLRSHGYNTEPVIACCCPGACREMTLPVNRVRRGRDSLRIIEIVPGYSRDKTDFTVRA